MSTRTKDGNVTFVRVDSDTVDNLVQKDETTESVLSEDDQKKVEELFKATISDAGANVSLKALSPEDQPIVITRPEFMRRMREMQSLQGAAFGDFPETYNVVVNTNHELVASKLLNEDDDEKRSEVAQYLFNLAQLNQGMLRGAALEAFVKKSLGFLK